jgi:hypothetical protein
VKIHKPYVALLIFFLTAYLALAACQTQADQARLLRHSIELLGFMHGDSSKATKTRR